MQPAGAVTGAMKFITVYSPCRLAPLINRRLRRRWLKPSLPVRCLNCATTAGRPPQPNEKLDLYRVGRSVTCVDLLKRLFARCLSVVCRVQSGFDVATFIYYRQPLSSASGSAAHQSAHKSVLYIHLTACGSRGFRRTSQPILWRLDILWDSPTHP